MSAGDRVPSDEPPGAEPDRDVAALLRPCLPVGFAREVTVLSRGKRCSLRSAKWRDALVIIVRGRVVITTTGGDHTQFEEGAIMTVDGLHTGEITNVGDTSAVIVSVSRSNTSGESDDFCLLSASDVSERPTSDDSIPSEYPRASG